MSLGRSPQDERTAGPGRRRGRIIVLAVLLAALSLGAVPVSAAAVAGRGAAAVPSVVLCSGYRGCDRAGYDSYGYGEHGRSSYWRMDAGNECTNYVAYVEARYFRVATPGYRLGNAYQWPTAAAAHGVTVSKVPSVGSVAVWDGGAYGIGPDGHVAVVERVGPRHRYIVVSQQHLRGVANGYEWTRINAGFPARAWESWPSQFIHFRLGRRHSRHHRRHRRPHHRHHGHQHRRHHRHHRRH
jgi:surface antigen